MHRTYSNPKTLTRRALIRALATPARSRAQARQLADQFVGDSPVPPAWGLRGVRATFGTRVAREWARHLRHRRAGRDPNVRGRFHVVQTLADLGASEGCNVVTGAPEHGGKPFMPVDEYHQLMGLVLESGPCGLAE